MGTVVAYSCLILLFFVSPFNFYWKSVERARDDYDEDNEEDDADDGHDELLLAGLVPVHLGLSQLSSALLYMDLQIGIIAKNRFKLTHSNFIFPTCVDSTLASIESTTSPCSCTIVARSLKMVFTSTMSDCNINNTTTMKPTNKLTNKSQHPHLQLPDGLLPLLELLDVVFLLQQHLSLALPWLQEASASLGASVSSSDPTLSHVDQILLLAGTLDAGSARLHLGLADRLLLLLGSGPLSSLNINKPLDDDCLY